LSASEKPKSTLPVGAMDLMLMSIRFFGLSASNSPIALVTVILLFPDAPFVSFGFGCPNDNV